MQKAIGPMRKRREVGRSGNKIRIYKLHLALPCAVLLFVATGISSAVVINTQRVTTGLNQPVFVDAPSSDYERLFVLERSGDVRIINLSTGTVNAQPFLSIPNVNGAYGLAFHPDYASNGLFYVNFVDSGGKAVLLEYHASASDPNLADPLTKRVVLSYQRHNEGTSGHAGGWIDFSPTDGYLYVSTGDGGKASYHDKDNRAQDITDQFLGKLLRIDVNGDQYPQDDDRNYSIPPSNPFVDAVGDDEIWAYGLRNPWRPSFDRQTGDLYIADVGQNTLEEVDFQPASSAGGTNYGWRLREGTIETPTGDFGGPKPLGAIDPFYEYPHGDGGDEGFSVTGGYVYRGPITPLRGKYFLADYVSNRVWSIVHDGSDPAEHNGDNISEFLDWTDLFTPDAGVLDSIVSFGEDAAGNLYLVGLDGDLFRVSGSSIPGDFNLDDVVDAADYAVWRSNLGKMTPLPNETATPGQVTIEDYATWRANYRNVAGSSASKHPVPEPTMILAFAGLVLAALLRRKIRTP